MKLETPLYSKHLDHVAKLQLVNKTAQRYNTETYTHFFLATFPIKNQNKTVPRPAGAPDQKSLRRSPEVPEGYKLQNQNLRHPPSDSIDLLAGMARTLANRFAL